jgi:hypothetical protein
MNEIQIETLITTSEGRQILGRMAATDDVHAILQQQLSMMDVLPEWLEEIESARLAKLREMGDKDSDAQKMIPEADILMQKTMHDSAEHAVEEPQLETLSRDDLSL